MYQFPYGKGKSLKLLKLVIGLRIKRKSINSRMGKVRTVFCDTLESIRFILYIVNTITAKSPVHLNVSRAFLR